MSITGPAIHEESATERGIHAYVDASSPPPVTTGWSAAEMEAVIMEAGRLLYTSRHRLVVALAAFDRDGCWAFTGARTCAHWAADRLGVSVGTARECAGELVELAVRARPGELGRDLARWTHRHDTDGQREDPERRQTYVSWRIEPDGMCTITMRLPAIDLGVIQAAVDARVMQSHRSDPHDLRPPLGRQRVAALVDLLRGEDAGTTAERGEAEGT